MSSKSNREDDPVYQIGRVSIAIIIYGTLLAVTGAGVFKLVEWIIQL